MRDLNKLKSTFRDLAVQDLGQALLMLKEQLKPDTALFIDVLSALERHIRLNKSFQKGMISYQEADLLLNQVFHFAISIVKDLQDEHLL